MLLTLAAVVAVVILSTVPGQGTAGDSVFSWVVASTPRLVQKLMHVVVYAILTFLWMWTLEGIQSTTWRLVLALLLTTGLGIALEWYQISVPGRFGSVLDVLLNFGGSVAGVVLALLIL